MNKAVLRWMILLSLIFLVLAPIVSGQIYKWRDKEGYLHYSEYPPPELFREETPADSPEKESPEEKPEEKPVTQKLSRTYSIFSDGVFWEIRNKYKQSCFLLGTIHSEDERVTELHDIVKRKFKESKTFIMETDPTASDMLAELMFLNDGSTLKMITGDELFEQAVKVAAEYGITANVLIKMKPWVVMSTISMPKPKTGLFLDFFLYKDAVTQSKKIIFLESIKEQVDIFDGISLEDQVSLLKSALHDRSKFNDLIERIIQSYVADNLSNILVINNETMKNEDENLVKRIMKRLNDDRNTKMVERLIPHLEAGDAFIAVGALHLPGEKGIIKQLLNLGYRVISIPVAR